MTDSPFVWFQESSHNGIDVTFNSSPAIITGRSTKAFPVYGPDGLPVLDAKGAPIISSAVEVVSLTVFLAGSIEFLTDIRPYSDDLGRLPGTHTYRAIDAAEPKVDLRPNQSPKPPSDSPSGAKSHTVDEALFGPKA